MKVIAQNPVMNLEEKSITFTIPNYRHLNQLKEIDAEKPLSLSVHEVKESRSLEQNKLLWGLLHEIDKKVNGDKSHDPWSLYLNALKRTGAKFTYVYMTEQAMKELEKDFRAIEYVMDADEVLKVYRVYYGSSKFNVREMNKLIDVVLDMAAECGIDTLYWEGVLK